LQPVITMARPMPFYRPQLPDYLSTAVVVLDAARAVRYLNASAEALFAVSARQLVGQPLSAAIAGSEQFDPAIDQALTTGVVYTERERRLQVPGGQPITVDCTVTPLPGEQVLLELSQLDRHLRISRDQNLLAQGRAIRDLVRGLAHEIKNPLGGLRGAAQLLERELDRPELAEYTRVIIGEADRLQTLVDGLLGPTGMPQRRLTNIHEVLERVRQLVQVEAPPGVEIRRDYDPSIPPLLAEPDQLIQAVLNIVRNALQALGGRGRITLRSRTQRQFTIAETPHKLVVRLDISDDGPGVPPEILEKVFVPMVTTRPEGTGLGLPIAQTLINRHGGLIECSSRPGETVFTIWLPLEDEHDH
jgi:two-component system nitrogen regulation sensor histidine kinase GlnL